MIWGIVTLLFAFFLGPLAKKTTHRLGLSGLYIASAASFLIALLELDSPLYYHFVPQTFALFDLSFVADTLSLIFCVLITFIGAIVTAYSAYYIEPEEAPRFTTLINFFSLSMVGLVLSNNLLGLFIFWEFTSICSYFLISFDGTNEKARKSAWQSLLITSFGGLCLLCGLLILGGIGGTYDLLQMRIPIEHPWLGTTLILIFLGVFTKSAQFPFHFWLPNAMTAPSPASAFLHSATMVKAGVFLLLRLSPFLAEHAYWGKILIPTGFITAGLASILLLFEKDLKRIFAYTTIAALGLIVYMIGKNNASAYYLAVVWIVTHALYKAPLFLLAGNIEHYSGSRDVTTLSQLYPRMKGSLLVAALSIFSLLGLPPVLSSHAKGDFFQLLGSSPFEFALMILIFSTTGSVAITLLSIFLKSNSEEKVEGRFFDDDDDPALLWLPPAALAVISFMIGLRYGPFTEFLRETLGQIFPFDFSDIGLTQSNHTLATFSTAAVMLLAVFFAAVSYRLRKFTFNNPKVNLPNFDKIWNFLFNGLLKTSKIFFDKIQNNRIELYSLTFFVFLLYLITQIQGLEELGLPLLSLKFPQGVTPFEIALIAAMLIASTMAIKAESNLSALVVLGVIGFGIAYIYLVNSAPDLALTQFLIESLTLILLVLTFKHLPKIPYRVENLHSRRLYLVISIFMGLCAGTLTFLAGSSFRPQTLTRYFGEKSLNLAHGHNVVNVTIVDFRGFDTLGEITVLILAAVGVVSLLNRKKGAVAK
ncbi:MAG: hydrogen gas-evolving membrane-bound hydrogenase subunit E [Bdellovibrionota bacterium]